MTDPKFNDRVKMICTTCEFFKEDDIDLECAAFKILTNLLDAGTITEDDIRRSIK